TWEKRTQGGQILSSLSKFTFLHTLTNVPMDESSLCVHKVELVVQSDPGLGDSRSVGQHGNGSINLSQLGSWDSRWLLVVDSELEASWAPFDQVEVGFGLEGRNSSSAVAGHDVSAVEKGDSHVLSVARVADNHLVIWLKALESQVGNLEGFMGRSGGTNNWGVGDQWIMDTYISLA